MTGALVAQGLPPATADATVHQWFALGLTIPTELRAPVGAHYMAARPAGIPAAAGFLPTSPWAAPGYYADL